MTKLLEKERVYESMFLSPADVSQPQVDELIEKLKATIEKNGGQVKGVQVWGRRRLAFSIKKNRDGLYVYLDFAGDGKVVNELNAIYRVSDVVLRHITVVKEEPPVFSKGPDAVSDSPASASPAEQSPSKTQEG